MVKKKKLKKVLLTGNYLFCWCKWWTYAKEGKIFIKKRDNNNNNNVKKVNFMFKKKKKKKPFTGCGGFILILL